MRLLILTQYYIPETGAPQNRLHSLACHLINEGVTVEVLTAMPNYPKKEIFDGYRGKVFMSEKMGPVKVYRSWIFISKSNHVLARLMNYFSFTLSSAFFGLFRLKKYDLVLCESPPIFLGLTALALKIKGTKLIFNVSDLWPESAEKLGIIKNRFLLNITYRLEKLIYRKSCLVSGQTQGIVNNIKSRFPKVNTFWLRNGFDFEENNRIQNGEGFRKRMKLKEQEFVLIYAGILGYAQGLETVLNASVLLKKYEDIKIFLIGDGPEKEQLQNKAEQLFADNMIFLPNCPRNEVLAAIAESNASIVPLKKNVLFQGAIPSKLFEPLALGKPILLGVDGEARELFIERGKCGLYYEPENDAELAQCIEFLYLNRDEANKMGEAGKDYVKKHFNRRLIAHEFYEALMLTLPKHG